MLRENELKKTWFASEIILRNAANVSIKLGTYEYEGWTNLNIR